MTQSDTTRRRLLPEWSTRSAVLLSWPHAGTDWAYMLPEVRECYIQLLRALTRRARVLIVAPDVSEVMHQVRGLVDTDRIVVCQMPTNDTWARDFGMITVRDGEGWQACDFKFNGWGLKFAACHDNLITRRLMESGIFGDRLGYSNHLGFVLEGGAIDIDSDGTLLTTSECLLSPNRNGDLSKDEIEGRLTETLGCSKVIWLEHGALEGDDTDSHVDTLARYIPAGAGGRRIAYSACDRPDDIHYRELRLMEEELRGATTSQGEPYELIPLPIPHPIYDMDGQRLPATYANFLIINGAVYMPVYDDAHYDRIAVEAISKALPDYEVHTVNCLPLIQQHGSLHCVTMQIPEEVIGKR